MLRGGERLRAVDGHLAHVADVEDADAVADRGVLLEDAPVLHRHVPARELDHAGAGFEVGFVQRRALGHSFLRGAQNLAAGPQRRKR